MPVDVIMPKVDMVMDEGTVAHWHKAEGDEVKAGEPLFDIETDKATMEVEAPASGTLAKITAPNGTTVPVATVIALILQKGESLDQPVAPPSQPQESQGSTPVREAPQPSMPAPTTTVAATGPRPRATPLARKLAVEHGLDLATLSGGGPQGRIRKDDVLQAVETMRSSGTLSADGRQQATIVMGVEAAKTVDGTHSFTGTQQVTAPDAAAQAATHRTVSADEAATEDGKLVPLTGVRKIVAQRMTASAAIPQFTLTIEIDMSAALQMRSRLPFKPSVTAIIARVVAPLLQRHPTLNASFRDDGIWLHTPVHLGIALDSNGDLLVPVIRNAQQRSLQDLATAINQLRQRAEAKRLTPSELQGSTFSISNLGMFGIDHFTALINPPEAAILAVGRTVERLVAVDGAPVFKPLLTLTLSADHRVTDGATAARFLQDVRAALEEPYLLL